MSTNPISTEVINQSVGNMDLYLLDQVLKGRFSAVKNVLDAGCGEGRNLMYFLQQGLEVHGIDQNAEAIRMLSFVAGTIQPGSPKDRWKVGNVAALPYKDDQFDLVISSAVLHFAASTEQFWQMLQEQVRVLAPGGYCFIRMASLVGLDLTAAAQGGGSYLLPDGSTRFLLTRQHWEKMQADFGLVPVEPLKVVSVDGQRGMAALVLQLKK